MDRAKLEKLIDKAHRAAALAYNANTRALQYAGYSTGTKASERAFHWWKEFESTMDALREGIGCKETNFSATGRPLCQTTT